MKAKILMADTIQNLEAQLNHWLSENPTAQVRFIAQSESDASKFGWSVTLTILYA
jgi:hypothetical protein